MSKQSAKVHKVDPTERYYEFIHSEGVKLLLERVDASYKRLGKTSAIR